MKPESEKRVAVILSGGGAKGAYEVGVLKAIRRMYSVEPLIYCGTSVGAFNAAMLASGRSVQEVEALWTRLKKSDVFTWRFDPRKLLTVDPRVPLELAMHSARSLFSFVNLTISNRGAFWRSFDLDALLFDTEPLARLIRDNVAIDQIRINGKKLSIAVTCLGKTGEHALVTFDEKTVTHEHIHASCALPMIFPSIVIDDCPFCDGGVVMNTPLKLALERDPTDVFIVYLTPPPKEFVDATLPLAYQAMSVSFAATTRADLDVAKSRTAEYLAAFREDRLVDGKLLVLRNYSGSETVAKEFSYVRIYEINPRDDMGGLEGFLDFRPDFARELIEQGEADTERILREEYYEEVITSRSGQKMKALRHRKRGTAGVE